MAFKRHHFQPDAPTNTFATLNPLRTSGNPSATMYEGNLKYKNSSTQYYMTATTTMSLTGKCYWEVYLVGFPNILGIIGNGSLPPQNGTDLGGVGSLTHGYAFRYNRTEFWNNGSAMITGLNEYTQYNIVSFCFDANAGNLWYAIDGNWQQSGDPSAGTNPLITVNDLDDVYTPTVTNVDGSTTHAILNFGQNPDFSGQKTDSAGPYTDANGIGQFY